MKLKELTFEEQVEINGGSEASDSFWFSVGYGVHKLWNLISTSSDKSYIMAKVGSY
ncbi:MAG: hypothetical protein WCS03_16245 [Bacteroidota bacterium]